MGSCASRTKEANAENLPHEKPTSSKNAIPKGARGDPAAKVSTPHFALFVRNKAKSSEKQTSKNGHKEEPFLVDLSDPKLDGNAPSSSTDRHKSTITELVSEFGVSNPDALKGQMKASNDPIKAPEVIPVEEKAGVENEVAKNEPEEEPLLVDHSDPKLDDNAPRASTDKDKSTITELVSEIGVSNPDASQDLRKASDDPIKAPEVIPVEGKARVENEVAKNKPKEEPLLVDLSDPKLDGNAPSGASTDKDKSTITELVSEIDVSIPDASQDQRKSSDDPIKAPEVIPVEKAGVDNEVAKNERKEEPLQVDLSDPKLDGNAPSASTDKDKSTITELVSLIGGSNPDASQDKRKPSDDPIKAPDGIPVEEKAGVENKSADQTKITVQPKDPQTGDTAPKVAETEPKVQKSDVKGEGVSLNSGALEKTNAETFSTSQ